MGVTMVSKIRQTVVDFLWKEDGPTAVEYAFMLAAIITICIVAIRTVGSSTSNNFSRVNF